MIRAWSPLVRPQSASDVRHDPSGGVSPPARTSADAPQRRAASPARAAIEWNRIELGGPAALPDPDPLIT